MCIRDRDIGVMAKEQLELLPEEILEFCESIGVQIEELADESLESELDLEDPFELLALFKSGKQVAPGVEKKSANDDDLIILFRRPILDVWCETGQDLAHIIRETMIEEIGGNFDFTDDEIEEMAQRHYQGML